jgi:dihydropteroate synthase
MKPKLMGILNVTPDSFYDGGRHFSTELAVEKGLQLFHEGADILDVGGESTRPNAEEIPLEEEIARTIPVIYQLKKKCPVRISIDTSKPEVVKRAIDAGASLINDVSGFTNPLMVKAASGCEIVLMHRQGVPKTMQINPLYENGVLSEIINWFHARVRELADAGIPSSKIILDPGIGFGKTVADNLEILHNLPQLKLLGFPCLIGLSRKSFLSKILNKKPEELLAATVAANCYALLKGANIIRVHDVKEHRSVIDLYEVGFTLP